MDTLNLIIGNQSVLEALVNVVIIVVPLIVTWFVKNYVKSAEDEKKVALMASLASIAIGYVEDLDRNKKLDGLLQSLNLSPDVLRSASTGLKKLSAATQVFRTELDKRGITITDQEAQQVIRGEFQKLTGGLELKPDTLNQAQEAVKLLQALQQAGFITLPPETGDLAQVSKFLLNWMGQQGNQNPNVSPPQLIPQPVQAEPVPAPPITPIILPQPEVIPPSPEAQLADLARQAKTYVEELKSIQSLGVSEADIAVAWVLTEVTKQGLNVNSGQIVRAVQFAFT